jgi:hypothetical protein
LPPNAVYLSARRHPNVFPVQEESSNRDTQV